MNLKKFKGFTNPLTKEGMWALAIVLGAIVVFSAVVYSANPGKRRGSTVLPAKTGEEVEEELPASPSSTGKVRESTGTSTPAVEGAPTPTR